MKMIAIGPDQIAIPYQLKCEQFNLCCSLRTHWECKFTKKKKPRETLLSDAHVAFSRIFILIRRV